MSFLALIIAVTLLQVWGIPDASRHDNWFNYWTGKVLGSGLGGWPAFALLLAVPVAGAILVLDALQPFLFGLFWIVAAAALLLYSFGRSDFATLIERYRAYCVSGDFEAAWLYLKNELPGLDESEDVPDARALHQRVTGELVYEGYQRWFGVIFYFLLLGPAAALAYRLLQMASRGNFAAQASVCLTVADWLPARALALTFSLAGDFVGSREALAKAAPGSGMSASDLLQAVSSSAVGDSNAMAADGENTLGAAAAEDTKELAGLFVRSSACWLVVVSLLELLL
ncbi:MAG: hypothetical protein ABJK20_05425 [Halieaceae bacterium]